MRIGLTMLMCAVALADSALAYEAQPGAGQAAAIPPEKITATDSLRAQQAVWSSLHFLKRRPDERHIMAPAQARFRATFNHNSPIIPGDDWMAGVRFSFPVPGGPPSTRIAGLPQCRASGWWCDLLAMFALWKIGRSSQAESLLVSALGQMSAPQRCIWSDVSMLIDNIVERNRYERAGCAERAATEEKLWWLADPFFSIAGNERRVDHYARLTNLRLATELLVPEVDGFRYALRATRSATHRFSGTDVSADRLDPSTEAEASETARFRGPEGLLTIAFESMRAADYRRANYNLMETAVLHRVIGGPSGGDRPATVQFVPAFIAVQSPFHARADDWNLSAIRRRESGRSPVGPIVSLETQHAFFPRGDSARLVVVSEPGAHPFLAGAPMHAALASARNASELPLVHRTSNATRIEFSPTVPFDSSLVSLEVFAEGRGAGRSRFGAIPTGLGGGRLRVSDLLLFATDSSGAGLGIPVLDSAIRRALPSSSFARNSFPGLFWEVTGLLASDTVRFTVTVRKINETSSITARRLHTGSQRHELSFAWSAAGAGYDSIHPGQLVLDTSRLEEGHYELSLTVAVAGTAPAYSHKSVLVRK